MRICNLSSGSDGNLTYIESENARVLIDIGLSCRETERRLSLLKTTPDQIDAIFITHEHLDHMKGLEVFASKHKSKVFVHKNGYVPLVNKINRTVDIEVFDDNAFDYKDLTIFPISVPHDVKQCTGYSIISKQKKISIITDLGHTTSEILQNLRFSNLVFLEANHDVDMLVANPDYPEFLKQRILSLKGHLSNDSCAESIADLANYGTKNFVLSHLSTKNNTPQLAFEYISRKLREKNIKEGEDIKIKVASVVPQTIFRL